MTIQDPSLPFNINFPKLTVNGQEHGEPKTIEANTPLTGFLGNGKFALFNGTRVFFWEISIQPNIRDRYFCITVVIDPNPNHDKKPENLQAIEAVCDIFEKKKDNREIITKNIEAIKTLVNDYFKYIKKSKNTCIEPSKLMEVYKAVTDEKITVAILSPQFDNASAYGIVQSADVQGIFMSEAIKQDIDAGRMAFATLEEPAPASSSSSSASSSSSSSSSSPASLPASPPASLPAQANKGKKTGGKKTGGKKRATKNKRKRTKNSTSKTKYISQKTV